MLILPRLNLPDMLGTIMLCCLEACMSLVVKSTHSRDVNEIYIEKDINDTCISAMSFALSAQPTAKKDTEQRAVHAIMNEYVVVWTDYGVCASNIKEDLELFLLEDADAKCERPEPWMEKDPSPFPSFPLVFFFSSNVQRQHHATIFICMIQL
ncbi:uncharacterized protein EAF02_010194 [Botrytis sinoallii]|uniref:uncharacterized protein n=1 Tax=Botrytis sinoallii TaxID=1463999 RepID=UPI0019011BB1|nr:uncharacterized protein EAF02_010194 [Botrytis sinoallii]KAF7864226.1 hypothetical protein EAF02_010194 [Botrytis sinoallii]